MDTSTFYIFNWTHLNLWLIGRQWLVCCYKYAKLGIVWEKNSVMVSSQCIISLQSRSFNYNERNKLVLTIIIIGSPNSCL